MKKIFVLFICFCLFFAQITVFADDVDVAVSKNDEQVDNKPANDIKKDFSKEEKSEKEQKETDKNSKKEIEPKINETKTTPKGEVPQTKEQIKKTNIVDKIKPKKGNPTKKILEPVTNKKKNKSVKQEAPKNDIKKSIKKKPKDQKTYQSFKGKIRLNEILANPNGQDSGNEFIEIYNEENKSVQLTDLFLCDKDEYNNFLKKINDNDNTIKHECYNLNDKSIKSNGFLTLYNKSDFTFTLNNPNEQVYLIQGDGEIVSKFEYKKSTSGLSWNYDKIWYEETPTPDKTNTENPFTKKYPLILLNEIYPNPIDTDKTDEFIELYNPNNEDIDLKNWTLKDGSKTGKYIFKNETIIKAKNYLVLYKKNFKFALNNNTPETVTLIAPNGKIISQMNYLQSKKGLSLNRSNTWYFAKISPGEKNFENPKDKSYPVLRLNEILPNPSGDENENEYIEIYNPNDFDVELKYWTLKDSSKTGVFVFMNNTKIKAKDYFVIYRKDFKFALNNSAETLSLIAPNEKVVSQVSFATSAKENVSYNFEQVSGKWRWSKHLTPNSQNIFNNLPEITKFKIDKKIYKNVYAEFKAKAIDIDGEELHVRWDFGDGHKSYLWKTRHKYEKTGIYHASLRIQDESETVFKNFDVIVKKYPKYDISIIEIMPNPKGKDTGNEYIIIKNKSKKKINLKDWSIATGTNEEKLINHPVRKKLILKPGKTKVITKKYASIALPNKFGIIELRRPDGKVSYRLKYGDKNKSIKDDAIYKRVNHAWQWIIPKDLKDKTVEKEIIKQAVLNEQLFAKQKLESIVAYNAVHNPTIKKEIPKENTHLLWLKKINKLINDLIFFIQNNSDKQQKTSMIKFETYQIKTTKNPCELPTIYNFDRLDFCK